MAAGWNIFDSFVVVVCGIGLFFPGLPAVNVLRLVRIFKMVRVLRKLVSLRILINALVNAILPVCNAFIILLLITSIYAVMATSFFSAMDPDHFGYFSKSIFTLFQIATGDSWASVVTRGLMS